MCKNKLTVSEKDGEKETFGPKEFNVYDAHDLEPVQPLIRKKAKLENLAAKRNNENAKNSELTNYIKCPIPKINNEKVLAILLIYAIRCSKIFCMKHQKSQVSFRKQSEIFCLKGKRNSKYLRVCNYDRKKSAISNING
jgi:hypothetical protein